VGRRQALNRRIEKITPIEKGTDFLLLDVFSTAFIFTGLAEIAIQDTFQNGACADMFRNTMTMMRDGNEFRHALRGSNLSKDLCEWFSMVCSRSTRDSGMILDSWKALASRCLVKIEDMTSLVITFSSLLPVVMASLFLITGYGSSLLAFSVVFITVVTFLLVSRWMRELADPLG